MRRKSNITQTTERLIGYAVLAGIILMLATALKNQYPG